MPTLKNVWASLGVSTFPSTKVIPMSVVMAPQLQQISQEQVAILIKGILSAIERNQSYASTKVNY